MQTIHQLQQLKVIGDSQRLAILRRLMIGPATLSQLGDQFQETPAHIRHHLKALELEGFVELASVHPVRGFLEKYYRASASAYLLNLVILPEAQAGELALVIGSNDQALQQAQTRFSQKNTGVVPYILGFDSLDGLIKLREGICQMATSHLLDPDSAEYNRTFVRSLFPGQRMALFHMYHREGGLLVQPGNPKHIQSLEDLTRDGIKFVNRERGSGIRVWLDDQLNHLGIPTAAISGYLDEAPSHHGVAEAIQEGRANAGLGLQFYARSNGLDFIQLFDEPYDLVLRQETLSDLSLAPFFDYIHSVEFRQTIEKIDGYRVQEDSGRVDLIL